MIPAVLFSEDAVRKCTLYMSADAGPLPNSTYPAILCHSFLLAGSPFEWGPIYSSNHLIGPWENMASLP
jgi:hypothetical protein